MAELSGETLFGIMSMALALILWVRVLMNKRHNDEWLDERLIERQDRIDSQNRINTPSEPPAPVADDGKKTGPWG